MKNKNITNHGMFHDTLNLEGFFEAGANTPCFLDTPKEYNKKVFKNYGNKPKVKKLSYKEVNNKDKLR